MTTLERIAAAVPAFNYLFKLKRRFNIRYCRGVFRTFQEARAAIPSGRSVGYDNPAAANLYVDRGHWVRPSDRTICSWLGRLLTEHRSVFDFGGNLGRLYFAFQRLLCYPPDLRWLICDVPAVIALAREMAPRPKAAHLGFTTEFDLAEGFEILLTAGTLQYAEQELAQLLSPLANKPRHLLINRVPLSDRATCYTVQDIGPACCPYRIGNRAEFLRSLQHLGYSVVASWHCPESKCRILFHPTRGVGAYSGMYLRLSSS